MLFQLCQPSLHLYILDAVRVADLSLGPASPVIGAVRVLRSRRRADGSVMLELGLEADALSIQATLAGKLAAVGIPFGEAVQVDISLTPR